MKNYILQRLELPKEVLRADKVDLAINASITCKICQILGGIISRGLCCKINTIKGRDHNKRGGLVW